MIKMRPRPILFILILAAVLRMVGLNWGLPQAYHQDEPIIVNHALAIGVEGWNTKSYLPPQFASYFLFLVYAAYYAIGSLVGLFKGAESFALSFFQDPTTFYLLGRFFLGVVPGVLTVYALYRLAERFFDAKTAFWAAFLLAVNFIHVQHSHYIYVDILLSLACTLLFYTLLESFEQPSFKNFLKQGAAFGWAVSVKYTAVYFFPVMLAACLMTDSYGAGNARRCGYLAAAGALAVFIYALISPFSFLDWNNFISQVAHQSSARGYVGIWHHFAYSLFGGTGIVFMILSVLGMAFLAEQQKKRAQLLILSIAVYFFVNVMFSQPFARYMMPVIPLFCLFAAGGIARFTYDPKSDLLKGTVVLVTCVELFIPTLFSDVLFLSRDTRTNCEAWFQRNVPSGSVVVVDNHFFGPHLRQSANAVKEKYGELGGEASNARKKRLDLELKALNARTAYRSYLLSNEMWGKNVFLFLRPSVHTNKDSLKRIGAQYLVLNYSDYAPETHQFADSIVSNLELVARFSPYRSAARKRPSDPYASTGAPHLLDDLQSRKRMGPYLEVYRIKDL